MAFDKDRFIAGFCGSLALQVLHPLDVLRFRKQSIDKSKYQNVPYQSTRYIQFIKEMLKQEGIWSLYRGALFSMTTNIFLGIFFVTNEKMKQTLQKKQYFKQHPNQKFFFSSFVICSFFATIYCPFFVIKTWILLDHNKYTQKLTAYQAMKQIYRMQGIAGFYRGYIPMTIIGLNGTITVGLNDLFKKKFDKFYQTYYGNFILAGSARLLSSAVLYPFNTIRTRLMQNQHFEGLNGLKYQNFKSCLIKTYKEENIRGFYQGFGAYAPKSFLSSALLFTVYEKTYQYLTKNKL